jgi:hypothetical protein
MPEQRAGTRYAWLAARLRQCQPSASSASAQ